MLFARHKLAAIAIASILSSSMIAASIMLVPVIVPTASAHTPPWSIPTYAFINVSPNPVGVGQRVLVIMWIDKLFSPETGLANDYRFHNYQLTITPPNGTATTTTFSIVSDPTSAQTYSFTPDQVGTYTLNFTFPGQDFNAYSHPNDALVNDTYLPSNATTTLSVQQQALPPAITSYPLPTEYWTRPIYGENPAWWAISSNWLGTGAPVLPSVGGGDIGAYGIFGAALNRFPGDAVGPLTGHIMWTKPLQSGGVVGGNTFQIQGDTYFEGSAYDQRYNNPIILDGKIFYQAPLNFNSEGTLLGPQTAGTFCVDLRTGEVIWTNNNIPAGQISFGYIYDTQQPNQKGVFPPILFTNNFAQAYDADTGIYLFNVTNVPGSGAGLFGGGVPETMGPNGEHLRYIATNVGTTAKPNWTLAQWNSSNLWNWNIPVGGGTPEPATSTFNITTPPGPLGPGATTTYTNTVNGGATNSTPRYAGDPGTYDWNVTLPSTLPSSFTQVTAIYNNLILCLNGTLPLLSTGGLTGISNISSPYTYFAINLNATRGAVGSILWTNTVNPPPGNLTVLQGPADPQTGVFVEGYKETMQWVGYNLYTGQKMWGPTPGQESLDYYGNPITPLVQAQLAYGKLYSSGYAGILYAYNLTNGNLVWTYGNDGGGNSTRSGFETPFGDYPTFINAVGNGVIYLVSSEHTIGTPIYKGALARAVNATDGTEIWTLSSYTGEFASMSYAIADGYATWFNGYDNQIYSVGRGPSALTVTAPGSGVYESGPVVISGTVLDIASGTTQNEQAARFPNGVPVCSDASMKDWMGYVYQQKPIPTNFTGVPVSISVLDSNGNSRTIGTAVTDTTGHYSLTWLPDIAGNFTVTAVFAGTNGYWPSYATTSFAAASSAAPTTGPTAGPGTQTTDTYILGSAIAIIIVIIIVGAVIILMTRRR